MDIEKWTVEKALEVGAEMEMGPSPEDAPHGTDSLRPAPMAAASRGVPPGEEGCSCEIARGGQGGFMLLLLFLPYLCYLARRRSRC